MLYFLCMLHVTVCEPKSILRNSYTQKISKIKNALIFVKMRFLRFHKSSSKFQIYCFRTFQKQEMPETAAWRELSFSGTNFRKFRRCYCHITIDYCFRIIESPNLWKLVHAKVNSFLCIKVQFAMNFTLCNENRKTLNFYSMIIWNWNKVNSYISALKPLSRVPNRSKWHFDIWDTWNLQVNLKISRI